ncbi:MULTISPECIES: hypothetical protein [unclassified Neorhizobium]|uniref:hypothetical protein n=1 Tax=unclassified Neorhizobium TaxID=2629175 RepID=UPI001FF52A99|nr:MULTISPECIES: hypothetical protein [unclassified Neorhizobium]MCJ9670343.1 hypothetical protein [Neorhizobium sp. SHOUNA12B]MCJ9746598.1 hypothetical protein [Neorhizobium sp. SHOUNA12A]
MNDWTSDPRILEAGGLIAIPDGHRLCGLVVDCFEQIVGELDRSGTVEGLLSVLLLIIASSEPDAMLLGHPDGNAIAITIGLLETIEAFVQRALMNPEFLVTYLPQPQTNKLSEERREFWNASCSQYARLRRSSRDRT